MSFMFCRCSSLRKLDLSSFDTSSVSSMVAMFKDCISLEYLDISSFTIREDTDKHLIFDGCRPLKYSRFCYLIIMKSYL